MSNKTKEITKKKKKKRETDGEIGEVGPHLIGRELALVHDDIWRQTADVESRLGSWKTVCHFLPQHKNLKEGHLID